MKAFEEIAFNYDECQKEANELQVFLGSHTSLKERDEILPFFKQRKHLSAFVGVYNSHSKFDRVAHELDLFGDFACDLAAGDWGNKKFVLVEFENAEPDSVFVKKRNKATLEWAPRFEHGFSQILDWFYKLDSHRHSPDFAQLFGNRTVEMAGLLIVGRKQTLGLRDQDRLVWRQQHVQINGHKIHCMTFDDLCEDMLSRLSTFPVLRRAVSTTGHTQATSSVHATATVTPAPTPQPPSQE